MQGINAKEHQNVIEAYRKFEELVKIVENKLPQEEDNKTRKGMEEIRSLYFKFCSLLSELNHCTQQYEKKKKVVQSRMYKNIRKMSSELRKKGPPHNF